MPSGNTTGTGAPDLFADEAEWEGVELLDIDRIVDRHEVAHLIWTEVAAVLYAAGSGDTQSVIRAGVEVSASPGLQVVREADATDVIDDQTGSASVSDELVSSDTADLLVPPMVLGTHYSFDDSTNGTGGGPHFDRADVEGPLPGSFDFDRRDEVLLNGFVENTQVDGAIHMDISGSMVFAITED